VPYLVSKMEPRMGELPRPSKLIERGQIYFQCGEEMTTSRDLELLGNDCLFWASDFPHEGIVDMAKAVREFLDRQDIADAAKRKISYDNPKRLYAL
jgi:predicted TIM-barrel fold metal-dependent hydrolase